jgi:hypothetical protein
MEMAPLNPDTPNETFDLPVQPRTHSLTAAIEAR